jgi:hypothetical protein
MLTIDKWDKTYNEINNHHCMFCNELCTNNSKCSDRYFAVQGEFSKTDKIMREKYGDITDEIFYEQIQEIFYVCDKCEESYEDKLESGQKIKFKNVFEEKGYYVIDLMFRMND